MFFILLDLTNEKGTQSNVASEVDASVENSKFEKRKSRRFVRSIRSLCLMLTEKQDFETSNKKEFRLREVLYV